MNKNTFSYALLGATLSLAIAAPAQAGSADGAIQVKALGTAVLPDGAITNIVTNTLTLPALAVATRWAPQDAAAAM